MLEKFSIDEVGKLSEQLHPGLRKWSTLKLLRNFLFPSFNVSPLLFIAEIQLDRRHRCTKRARFDLVCPDEFRQLLRTEELRVRQAFLDLSTILGQLFM